MILDVSGVGRRCPIRSINNMIPMIHEVLHKLTNDLMWLGDSMAALRTYDVLRALDRVELMELIDQDDIQIYASDSKAFMHSWRLFWIHE